MKHDNHGGKPDQLEEHSLPGTNQAGKGPGSPETGTPKNAPRGAESPPQGQLENHSLPGTNQAGKGLHRRKRSLKGGARG